MLHPLPKVHQILAAKMNYLTFMCSASGVHTCLGCQAAASVGCFTMMHTTLIKSATQSKFTSFSLVVFYSCYNCVCVCVLRGERHIPNLLSLTCLFSLGRARCCRGTLGGVPLYNAFEGALIYKISLGKVDL